MIPAATSIARSAGVRIEREERRQERRQERDKERRAKR